MSDEAGAVLAERVESSRYRAVLELASLDKSDFDGVLRQILITDARELDLERVNCWALEGRGIRCVAGYLRGSNTFEAGTVIEAISCPSYFRALADDPVILADDARTDLRTREFRDDYLVPLGITSMMDVPIWVRGRLWGVVCHEHVGPARRWTDADRDFAISIGHIVAMAVEAAERADVERIARFGEFFVGVLSHDLRNPLATIRAATEVLREGDDIARRSAIERIERNSELMGRMIEQLLDLTRIRVGGGMPMNRVSTDLAALVKQVVSDLGAGRVDVDVRGSGTGLYDVDRIWQAVSNLLGNALRHGSGRVGVLVDGTDAEEVVIEVTNAGSIPDDILAVIFDPFRRHHMHERSGLGLGLYIAREIATAHDGAVSVVSASGTVTFTMMLPRRPPRA